MVAALWARQPFSLAGIREMERSEIVDWLHFIRVMIVDERGAVGKYQIAAAQADDPKVKAMFEQLRDEEKIHIAILEQHEERIKEHLRQGAEKPK